MINLKNSNPQVIKRLKLIGSLCLVGSMLLPEKPNGFVVPIIRLTTTLVVTELFGLPFVMKNIVAAILATSFLIVSATATHLWAVYDISHQETYVLNSRLGISNELWTVVATFGIVAFWVGIIVGCLSLRKFPYIKDRNAIWVRLIVAITSAQMAKTLVASLSVWVGIGIYCGYPAIAGKVIKDRITLELAYYLIYLVVVTPLVIFGVRAIMGPLSAFYVKKIESDSA